jgi:multidrug efflux pump subunit AcrB
VKYDASSVPVLQLSLTSDRLNEQQLYDYGYYNLRQQLAPVPGVTFPTPDGGKRQVHDGWAVQQNIVRENGQRSVLLNVLKNGNASTSRSSTESARSWRSPAPQRRPG